MPHRELLTFSALISNWRRARALEVESEMGSVAVGAMVVGTSLLVVFALAMATLEAQVDDSIAQIEASAEPVAQFTIENANNVEEQWCHTR